MRARTIATIVFVACASAAHAAPSDDVRRLLDAQVSAWNAKDLERFMGGYWRSPELTFYSGATVTRGWQATLDRYRKRYQSEGRAMGTLAFGALAVDVIAPDAAIARGEWRLAMPDGTTPHGLFTLVLRKFSDGWRIVHDHTSAE